MNRFARISIRFILPTFISLLLLFNLNNSFAAHMPTRNQSAQGYWLTWSQKTKKPSSVIKIWKQKGKFFGKIYKTLPHKVKNPLVRCTKCKDARKNRPILGLTIVRDMIYKDGKYVGGYILDPRNGKEYHATMKIVKNGKQLHLRGYIGLPIFGQTRTWSRVSASQVRGLKGKTA